MELTDDQYQLLLALPRPRGDCPADIALPLVGAGLARHTVTNLVRTDAGTAALTAHDGKTRLTVERWGRNAKGGPA